MKPHSVAVNEREQFYELVRLLGACADPYSVAAAVLAEALGIVDELRQEMNAFLDDFVALARMEHVSLPEAMVTEVRQDLHQMGQLREQLDLRLLFSTETRERCGRQAVPVLALTLWRVGNWVDFGVDWLASVDRLRIQVDALLGDRLGGHRPVTKSGGVDRASRRSLIPNMGHRASIGSPLHLAGDV